MDRLFEDFGMRPPPFFARGGRRLRRLARLVPADWTPHVDVRERDGRFIVRADLPGLSKDDIQVELGYEVLTIRGERRQEKKEEREGYSYSECRYGSFYRAIPLPEGCDASKVTAEFRDGVLEVSMPAPRHPETQRRRLEVREGK
jgi:HSP20 family protein